MNLAGETGETGETGGTDAWEVSGKLEKFEMELEIPFVILAYPYMQVDLEVRRGGGEPQHVSMRLHSFLHAYGGGWGAKDEIRECISRFLIESSREILARLNEQFFRAAPAPGIADMIAALKPNPVDDDAQEMRVLMIGLSGDRGATQKLLDLLPQTDDENERAELVKALADLGDPKAIPVLASRYESEDEDVRLYTLIAFDYIGGDEAAGFIEKYGAKDKEIQCRRVASRVAGP